MKSLIEKLKAGVIYYDTHHVRGVDEEITSKLMMKAAEKLEEMQAGINSLKSGEPDYYVYAVLDGCDLVEEAVVEYKASKTQMKSFLGYTILSEEKLYLKENKV